MQERVEVRSRAALRAVSFARGERVSERTGKKERHRRQGACGERGAPPEHEAEDHRDLQYGDRPLFDAVDEHALDIVHVLDDARHDIARGPLVEPRQRQRLEPRVEVAAQVEEDLLLERVVEQDAKDVEPVLREEPGRGERDHGPQGIHFPAAEDVVHDALGDDGKHDDHDRRAEGAGEGGRGEQRVAPQVGENAGENSWRR